MSSLPPSGQPPEAAQANTPAAPVRAGVAQDWPHKDLYERVIIAVRALPNHFETQLVIEGVPVSDLFNFNTALGASIENAMVESLNDLREVWDPNGAYKLYRFVRQPQAFPDVRLQRNDGGPDPILMGIELKGWFVLAKEGEPSGRFKATPAACNPQDLLVVVPWVFKNVISGKPMLLTPVVEEARYAALMRNHHWEQLRQSKAPANQRGINLSTHTTAYPQKADQVSDVPISDSGGNFGRFARSGITELAEGMNKALETPVAGISINAWNRFFSSFKDVEEPTGEVLSNLGERLVADRSMTHAQRIEIANALRELADKLEVEPVVPPPAAAQKRRSYSKE